MLLHLPMDLKLMVTGYVPLPPKFRHRALGGACWFWFEGKVRFSHRFEGGTPQDVVG